MDSNDQSLKLQLNPRWVRNMYRPFDFVFGPVSNPFPVFWIVLKGTRYIEIGDHIHSIKEGDLVVFPPGIPYRLVPATSSEPIHYLSLGCEAKIGPFGIHELYALPEVSSQIGKDKANTLIQTWFRLVDRYIHTVKVLHEDGINQTTNLLPMVSASIAMLDLKETLHCWFADFLRLMQPQIPEHTWNMDNRIAKACIYLRENAHKNIRLEDVASHVYLSQSHFIYLFRKSLGQPPAEYLRNYRIQWSKELLVQTSHPISEISNRVGYADQSQFSRAFRKVEGIGPLAYRLTWGRNKGYDEY